MFKISGGCSLVALACTAVSAQAQSSPPDAGPASRHAEVSSGATPKNDSGEIIVTGLKRDEKFINAPVAVQVFNEATISRAGITRPQDFLALTPNVTFIQSNHAGEAFVNIRGQTSVRQSESAVAVVIDGVQLATQNEFNGELFDIQQIEVLKGPQGAIYGRNASAGAIIITTKPPEDQFTGNATFGYGNWNSSRAVASVSGALIPGKLRARVSAAFTDSNGPFRNIITGEYPMRTNEKVGRARFDWNDGGPFTADLRFNISRVTGGAIQANAQGPGIVNGGVASPVNSDATNQPFVADVPGDDRQDKFSTSLKLDQDFGKVKLTSVSSYSEIADNYQAKLFPYQKAADPSNDPGNAILFGDQTQKYRIATKSFIQELRLASNTTGPFQWQAGIYFLTSHRRFTTEQGYNGRVATDADGNPIIGVNGFIPDPNGSIFASLDPAIGTAIFGAPTQRFTSVLTGGGSIAPTLGIDGLDSTNPTNSYDISRYDARNIAPFANFRYDVTDRLQLSVAARYDIERRTVTTLTPDVINPFTGGSFNQCVALFDVAPDDCHAEKTFKQVQPKISLVYKFPGLGSVYASWGRSFKSGGFNAFGTREIVVRATEVGGLTRAEAESLVFVQDSYKKEVADSYEVGFKSELFDRKLSLNGAGFYTDVANAQSYIFFPSGSIQAVSSIDKTRIKGVEFDTTLRATDTFNLFGGVGYIDPVIRAYAAQPTSVGNRTPYVAKYNVSAGFQLNQPLTDKVTLAVRGEYNREGSVWFDTANTPNTRRGPTDLVNARIGITTEHFDLSLWSRNLFNERYRIESVVLITGLGVFNPGFKAPTRSFGAEAKFRF